MIASKRKTTFPCIHSLILPFYLPFTLYFTHILIAMTFSSNNTYLLLTCRYLFQSCGVSYCRARIGKTSSKSTLFQKKLVGQNLNIWIYTPPISVLATALVRIVVFLNYKVDKCVAKLIFIKIHIFFLVFFSSLKVAT